MPYNIKTTDGLLNYISENEVLFSEELHDIIKVKYDLQNPLVTFSLIKSLANVAASYVSTFALSDDLSEFCSDNIRSIFIRVFNNNCDDFIKNAKEVIKTITVPTNVEN